MLQVPSTAVDFVRGDTAGPRHTAARPLPRGTRSRLDRGATPAELHLPRLRSAVCRAIVYVLHRQSPRMEVVEHTSRGKHVAIGSVTSAERRRWWWWWSLVAEPTDWSLMCERSTVQHNVPFSPSLSLSLSLLLPLPDKPR